MTIVEFLLDRIAEDEDAADAAVRVDPDRPTFTNDNQGYLLVQRAHVLAECAAKRAIVKMAQRLDFPDQMRRGKYWDGQRDAIHGVLEELADIYADHPDFDPAWRM